MPQARGSKAQLRIYEEAVRGTSPTGVTGLRLPVTSIDLGLGQSLERSALLSAGAGRSSGAPDLGEKNVDGSFGMEADVKSIGWVLKHAVSGTAGYSVTGAGPYTHVFKLDDLPPGLTLEKFFADLNFALLYPGSRIGGLSFDVTTSGKLAITTNVTGEDEIYSAAPIDLTPLTYTGVRGFRMQKATMSEGAPNASPVVAMAPYKIATSFSLDFSNELDVVRTVFNDGKIASLNEQTAAVRFSMTALFESIDQYNRAKNGDENQIILTFPAAENVAHSMQVEMQEVLYEVGSPRVTGPGGITADFNGEAFLDNGAGGSAIIFTLVNDVATYGVDLGTIV